MSNFDFTMANVERVLILRPSGYLNEEAFLKLRAVIDARLEEGWKDLVFNLEAVSVINSPGITQLLELTETVLYDYRGTIALVKVPALYVEVFQVIGLLRLTEVFSSEEDAVKRLK
ncbi:MAG: STAS domain-containing protein [Candidatus Rifleibacteriota bacterium]